MPRSDRTGETFGESSPRRPLSPLQRRDRWGNPAALWVLGGILFTMPIVGYLLQQLRLDNTIEQWLPASDPQMHVLQWFEREFGKEEMVLVSWDGSSWDDPRAGQFVERVQRKTPGRETGVIKASTPHDLLREMTDHGVEEAEGRRRIAGVLAGSGDAAAIGVYLQIDEQIAPRERTIEWIQEAAGKSGIPVKDLHLAGGIIIRKTLDESVRDNGWNPQVPWWQVHRVSPTAMSCLISVLLALTLLRSLPLAAMVLSVSVYTAGLTLALIPLTGGSMNMVLVVLAPLLIVLTLSGAIHLANYWKHATLDNPATAVGTAVRIAARPCFLAVATTAIGMLSLLTSDLEPVRSFGWLSAVGVSLSLGLILVGLPSLFVLWPPKNVHVVKVDHSRWWNAGDWLARHYRIIGGTCTAATIAAAAGLVYFRTETKLIRFFPSDSRIVTDYEFLEDNICGVVPIDLVLAFGPDALASLNALERMDAVRRLEERLREHPEISGTLSLASFREEVPIPGSDASAAAKIRYRKTAAALEKRLHDVRPELKGMMHLAENSLETEVGTRRIAIYPGTELWRIKAYASALTRSDYARITREIEALADATAALRDDVQALVTGTVPLFLRTQEAVLESLIKSFGLAFALIEIIMILLLRGARAGTLAMLPNVYPVAFVFGCVAWCGIPIDIGSMVTASVALGIAIDGTVHLLTWFENGLRSGMSRREAIAQALAHCGPAMWHTSAIICCGLLALLGADLLLISRFGWLMAALVFVALVGDVVYLPTLLAGSLGRLIEARVHQSTQNSSEQPGSGVVREQPIPVTRAAELLPAAHEADIGPPVVSREAS